MTILAEIVSKLAANTVTLTLITALSFFQNLFVDGANVITPAGVIVVSKLSLVCVTFELVTSTYSSSLASNSSFNPASLMILSLPINA